MKSQWLLNKLKASADKPEQTLLAVFDLLEESLGGEQSAECGVLERAELLAFLTQQSKKAGMQAPELFAQQIYLIASNALIQQQVNPGCNALHHAKQAASALINVQRKPGWLHNIQLNLSTKPFQYGLAASFSLIAGTAILAGYQASHPHTTTGIVTTAEAGTQLYSSQNSAPDSSLASPSDTAEMYATIEKMRDGRCRYIEALQLPTSQQSVYLQNVIAGQVSNKASEQKTARELMGKVDCDYTPMLMKNSKG
jgi:hypothetical protein